MRIVKAACVLALCLLLCCACGAREQSREEMPVNADSALLRDCVVYYESGGYLVPVQVSEPWSENIANSLAQSLAELHTLALEEEGLAPLLPEGAAVAARIDGRTAVVNLTGDCLAQVSAAQANNIVTAAVNTMAQFGAVDRVCVAVDGAFSELGGVDLSQAFAARLVNPAYDVGDLTAFSVYYQTADSGLLVPVTKALRVLAPEEVVQALLRAPNDTQALVGLFPKGTGLKSAELGDDGVLTLDFTRELLQIAETPEKEQRLLTGIALTCQQIEGVQSVRILVEGQEYRGSLQPTAAVFANQIV